MTHVIWDWNGNSLEAVETPRFLYPHEMAKKAYHAALTISPPLKLAISSAMELLPLPVSPAM